MNWKELPHVKQAHRVASLGINILNCAMNVTEVPQNFVQININCTVTELSKLSKFSELQFNHAHLISSEAFSQVHRLQIFVYTARLPPKQEKLLPHTCHSPLT
jgi:hypothetical protein